jgi:hypothetical protein
MPEKLVTTVRLTTPQRAFLKAEAERLDISEAELLRRILDAYREERNPK